MRNLQGDAAMNDSQPLISESELRDALADLKKASDAAKHAVLETEAAWQHLNSLCARYSMAELDGARPE